MSDPTIKELRAQTGLSQSEFASRFGIKLRTLQGWERGKSPQEGVTYMISRIIELEEESHRLNLMNGGLHESPCEGKGAFGMNATMNIYGTPYDTVNVVIRNCSNEVATLLYRLEVCNSDGEHKYDAARPEKCAEIWFECPFEFVDLVRSDMGREAFKRMGVENISIHI